MQIHKVNHCVLCPCASTGLVFEIPPS